MEQRIRRRDSEGQGHGNRQSDSEVATLTGICVDHIHNFAKSRHLGFIARAAERAGIQADQWLFTLSDLMVLVTLFPRCTH
jgi:hypothetical protein